MNINRAFLTSIALMLLPGLASALQPPGETVRFVVEKIWVDTDLSLINNDQKIVVEIVCNTGLPLKQEATISSGQGNGVIFVVQELFEFDGLKCTIDEKSGVSEMFFKKWSMSNGEDLAEGGCLFNGENFWVQNECILVNQVKRRH